MTSEEFLSRDNKAMRIAGCKLAEAAIRVIREYDGLHRLSLAVAEWSKVIACEGGRGVTKNALKNQVQKEVEMDL